MRERNHGAFPSDAGTAGAVSRVLSAHAAGRERLIFFEGWEVRPAGLPIPSGGWFLALKVGILLLELLVGVADEQGFHLRQKIAGPERFEEQRVRIFSGPIFSIPTLFRSKFSVPISLWSSGCVRVQGRREAQPQLPLV
jgi:hypothetical protein